MLLKDYIHIVASGGKLDDAQAYNALLQIMSGDSDEIKMSAFISTYLSRNPSIEELSGFRKALMQYCTAPQIQHEGAIDIVGTGGDGKHTFNISTCASIVISAAGYPVIKHGNNASTSTSGASNVLAYLGYDFHADCDKLQKSLDRHKYVYLHAPLYHTAMYKVSNVRKEIGLRTFFNLLGPLVNPIKPQYLLAGTSSLSTARLYHYLLQRESKDYIVLHDLAGYDEVSLYGDVKIFGHKLEKVLTCRDFGISNTAENSLYGGSDIDSAAKKFMAVLANNACENALHTVAANAALAIQLMEPNADLKDITQSCIGIIKSGTALKHFKNIINSQ